MFLVNGFQLIILIQVPLEHHKIGDIVGFEVGDFSTSSAASDGSVSPA